MTIAYIIDDEEHSALLLKDKILDVTDYFDKIEVFTKPVLAFQAIKENKPDVIFSDIEMPLMNGVDLHAQIANLDIPLIYVTAYSKYSLKAIKLQAFDYILKPVKEEELEETIKRYILSVEVKKIDNNETSGDTFYDMIKKQKNRITVSTAEGVFVLLMEDIVKIEALNNYSNIYLKDKSIITAPKTLKYFENQLNDFGFIRTHKSNIVNLIFIDRLPNNEGGHIQLKTGDTADVSRDKRNEIKEWFNS